MDLSYTFDNVNALTALADSDDSTYSAVVTCDANGNITEIEERRPSAATSWRASTNTTLTMI